MAIDLSASWSYLSGRRGTVPYNIIWGLALEECGGEIPVIVYGEKLFDIAGWKTAGDVIKNIFSGISGLVQPFQTYRNINDYKLPDSHHLDINANLSVKHRLGETIVGLCVYNVYNHYNISNVYMGYSGNKAVLKGICPFPIMPSINITQKF